MSKEKPSQYPPSNPSRTLNPRRPQQRLHKPIRPTETFRSPTAIALTDLLSQRMRRDLALTALFLESKQLARTEVASAPSFILVFIVDSIKERMRNPLTGIDGNALAIRGGKRGRVGDCQVCVGGPADEEVLEDFCVAGEAEGKLVGC